MKTIIMVIKWKAFKNQLDYIINHRQIKVAFSWLELDFLSSQMHFIWNITTQHLHIGNWVFDIKKFVFKCYAMAQGDF